MTLSELLGVVGAIVVGALSLVVALLVGSGWWSLLIAAFGALVGWAAGVWISPAVERWESKRRSEKRERECGRRTKHWVRGKGMRIGGATMAEVLVRCFVGVTR